MTITKNTIIAEILNNDPTQGCVPIFLSTGMHCLGCMASHGETVEEACAVHGVDPDALVAELNDYFAHLSCTAAGCPLGCCLCLCTAGACGGGHRLRPRQIKRRTGGQRSLPACFGL